MKKERSKKMQNEANGFLLHQTHVKPRRLGADEVSLTSTNLTLSVELRRVFLDGVERVQLLYHPETHEIAIRPVKNWEKKNSYRLVCRSIRATSFYKRFKIQERGRFKGRVRNSMLVIALGPKPVSDER